MPGAADEKHNHGTQRRKRQYHGREDTRKPAEFSHGSVQMDLRIGEGNGYIDMDGWARGGDGNICPKDRDPGGADGICSFSEVAVREGETKGGGGRGIGGGVGAGGLEGRGAVEGGVSVLKLAVRSFVRFHWQLSHPGQSEQPNQPYSESVSQQAG